MWGLHALNGPALYPKMTDELVKLLGTEKDPDVRAWMIQLIAENKSVAPALIEKFADLAKNDKAPIVRAYLASAMQRMPPEKCWDIAAGLLQHSEDAGDHNLPLVYWYSIEPLVMLDTTRAMELAKNSKIPLLSRYIVRLAPLPKKKVTKGSSHFYNADSEQQKWILEEMVTMLKTRANVKMPAAWKECYDKLVDTKNDKIREQAEFIAVRVW